MDKFAWLVEPTPVWVTLSLMFVVAVSLTMIPARLRDDRIKQKYLARREAAITYAMEILGTRMTRLETRVGPSVSPTPPATPPADDEVPIGHQTSDDVASEAPTAVAINRTTPESADEEIPRSVLFNDLPVGGEGWVSASLFHVVDVAGTMRMARVGVLVTPISRFKYGVKIRKQEAGVEVLSWPAEYQDPPIRGRDAVDPRDFVDVVNPGGVDAVTARKPGDTSPPPSLSSWFGCPKCGKSWDCHMMSPDVGIRCPDVAAEVSQPTPPPEVKTLPNIKLPPMCKQLRELREGNSGYVPTRAFFIHRGGVWVRSGVFVWGLDDLPVLVRRLGRSEYEAVWPQEKDAPEPLADAAQLVNATPVTLVLE